MINVVHVTTGLDQGGAELLLADLVARSNGGRFRHRVVSLLPGGAVRPQIEQTGIAVTDLGMRHARPSVGALLRLRRLIRESGAQVVHAWMYHACFAAALAVQQARRPRLLWGLHAANLDLSRYHITTTLVTSACRWLSRLPEAIVVNSPETRDSHARAGYRARRWVMVPNGIDTDRFKPDSATRQAVRAALGIPQDAPLIGFIARRDPQKDHVTFLRAAASLSARRPRTHFLLAGTGTGAADATMGDLVRRHAPHATMHLLGVRTDVPALTAALDVATMCSAYGESFSNVVVEAMACGVPSVVTRVPPVPSILGGAGLVVDVGDAAGLAAAWETLLAESAEARQARGEAARRRVQAEFSARLMVDRLEQLYQGVAAP